MTLDEAKMPSLKDKIREAATKEEIKEEEEPKVEVVKPRKKKK